MAELKTKRIDNDVTIGSLPDEGQRADATTLVELMGTATGSPAALWGMSIVGFGSRHYRYASGRDSDWFEIGFAPRKRN
jgi:hypothetical protein